MNGTLIKLYLCTVDGPVACLAVEEGTGRTWMYQVLLGQVSLYTSMEAATATLVENAVVEAVDQLPPHFAVPFGQAMATIAMGAATVAKALGVRVPVGGAQNIATGNLQSVVQVHNVHGGVHQNQA